MAPKKRKILESARKYAQKGSKDKALKEYQKLLKLDPRDAKLRLEIGDAHRRWGQVDQAIGCYSKVADQYMNEGFDARAVAVFKQILNLDPDRYASYVALADLYQRMGLNSEAIQALQTAADGYHKEGKKREALDLLRKMATLDPTNTTSRIKVGDLLCQEGRVSEGITEYEEAQAELMRQGEVDPACGVLERILEVEPQRVSTMITLAKLVLGRGHGDRAEPLVKKMIECQPDEIAHVEMLVDVYRSLGRDDDLTATYKNLAEMYRQRGDEDKAREIIQRYVPMDGEGLDGRAVLEADIGLGDDDRRADEPHLLSEHGLSADDLLDDDDIQIEEPDGRDLAEETIVQFSDGPSLEADDEEEISLTQDLDHELEQTEPAAEISGDPEQLLAEASVYLRYGKRPQAIENLNAILGKDPDHRGALEKLGEAHADAGESADAVISWLRAAQQAKAEGDGEALDILRDRISALDPDAAATLDGGAPAAAEDDDDLIDLEDDIEIDSGDPVEVADEATRTSVEPSEQAPSPEPSASTSVSQQVIEELEEAEFYHQQGLMDEAEKIYAKILEIAPNHPQARVRMGEIAAARGSDPAASAAGSTPAVADPSATSGEGEPGQDLDDWTDEDLGDIEIDLDPETSEEGVDSEGVDVEAETDDDATGVELPSSETAVPTSAEADPQQVEVGDEQVESVDEVIGIDDEDDEMPAQPAALDTSAAPALTVEAATVAESGDFDLAAELSGALDASPSASTVGVGLAAQDDGFAAVFQEFKKGVSQALGEGDYEAHYDLGIAYREMGLIDDAISEFKAAMAGETRRLDCLHMMGICCTDGGRAQEGLGYLQQALDSGQLSDEQTLPFRFEQGRAYEAINELDKARDAWQAVAAVDPSFCEVEDRLAALGQPKPQQEGFESFRDLFDDDDEVGDGNSGEVLVAVMDEATVEHESFDDLIAEASAVSDAVEAPIAERLTVSEPEPVVEVVSEPKPEPKKAPKQRSRKKKKISFV